MNLDLTDEFYADVEEQIRELNYQIHAVKARVRAQNATSGPDWQTTPYAQQYRDGSFVLPPMLIQKAQLTRILKERSS